MATLRFLPQSTLDAWADQGRADLLPDRLVDLARGAEYPAREAVHFVRVDSGADVHGLLNKVKDLQVVKSLGAECCVDSVILGETVYAVVPGWLAEQPEAAVAAPPAPEPPRSEADLLARLLLEKLS